MATRKSKKGGTAAGTPPGSGANFKAVEASAAKSGARNPAAVAAKAGQKKYGKSGMARLSALGRKRKAAVGKGK